MSFIKTRRNQQRNFKIPRAPKQNRDNGIGLFISLQLLAAVVGGQELNVYRSNIKTYGCSIAHELVLSVSCMVSCEQPHLISGPHMLHSNSCESVSPIDAEFKHGLQGW
jgi:hypothetical protein